MQLRVLILKPTKILAIQFKYLGDAVILTPALKALVAQKSSVELHVLVAAEVAPLLENLPWIKKVWAMPRFRGKLKLSLTLPFIRSLRREKFDQSVDFGGNDRGALLSFLSGAKKRLGSNEQRNSRLLQRFCYTQMIRPVDTSAPYFDLHFELLQAWGVRKPEQLKLEIHSNHIKADQMVNLLPKNSILCHISTSQPKKDWPLLHWQTLYYLARDVGLKLVFSAGPSEREQKMIGELKFLIPEAKILPAIDDLKIFLAVLKCSKIFVCGDTGPLHFAEGLGVPVLGIFGVGNSIRQVAPIYSDGIIVRSDGCLCDSLVNNSNVCLSLVSCMSRIEPEAVFLKIRELLKD